MICKSCSAAADILLLNIKEWGWDAATTHMPDSISKHSNCEYVDCYCQHTIEAVEYARY